MNNRIKLMGLCAAVLMCGCERIGQDERLVEGGGASGTWTHGVKNVYVEKYTGPRCNNCPAADRTLEVLEASYGERLVVVAVTTKADAFGKPLGSDADMRVEKASQWEDWTGVNSFPTAYVDRDRAKAYSGSMGTLGGALDEALQGGAVASVAVEARWNDGMLGIDVAVEMTQSHEGGLMLTLLLTEDSVVYGQLDGTAFNREYCHNNMLREVLTDSWGTPVPAQGTAGERLYNHFDYEVAAEVVPEHCKVVALLADAATRKVLNCDSSALK